MSEEIGIGNELNRMVQEALQAVFAQGELAQLSHNSFDHTANAVKNGEIEEYTFDIPIGYKPTKEPMMGTQTYKRDDLIARYSFLAYTQIPVNGIYQLVTVIEAMLSDVITRIILEYPEKISAKRQISMRAVLNAKSVDELHMSAVSTLLNELSYKSPREFAQEAEGLISINLLECPAYHVYIEMKATRDVLIHNRGIANEIYLQKAESHARVKTGELVPVTQVYFLEVYEACLQFLDWLERQLHGKWNSSEYVVRQAQNAQQMPKGASHANDLQKKI